MRVFRIFALLFIGVLLLSASTGCHTFNQGNPFFPNAPVHGGSGCSGGNGGFFGAPS